MKKLIISLTGLTILAFSVFAQSPQRMSYQAVVRNTDGTLVTSHGVGMKISILQGSQTGTLVYQEIFNPNPETNINGLVTIEIGGGIPLSGTFSTIDWSAGPYYLKTETDPTGATNYTISGTSQLLSVPYAFHATTVTAYAETDPLFAASPAGGITAANVNNWNTAYDWGDHSEADYAPSAHTHSAEDIGAATIEYVDALQDKIAELENKLVSGGLLVKDADGNIYSYVNIGNKAWLAENLRTTKYSDGTEIPLVTGVSEWASLSTPGYCWYNNNQDTYGTVYGALYNWFAVNTTTNGGKNVCPTGWHVPTHDEWTALETYLIANGYNYDGTTTGNKIAKSMAATTNWTSSGISGVPGNTDYPAKRNILGFTGLPGGFRNAAGGFFLITYYSIWWSSVVHDSDPTKSWARGINYDVVELVEYADNKRSGFSIRCLRD